MNRLSHILDFSLKIVIVSVSIFISQALFDRAFDIPTFMTVVLAVIFAVFLSCVLNPDIFNRAPSTAIVSEAHDSKYLASPKKQIDLLDNTITNMILGAGCLALLFVGLLLTQIIAQGGDILSALIPF